MSDGDQDGATKSIRVFLLDDHEIVRRGLAELIGTTDDLTVVGEASTAAEAIARVPAVSPDVALLDARLPDGSGIDVCRELRSQQPTLRCLILTSYDDNDAVFAAVMAGASGYLLKSLRASNLLGAIRHVASGKSLLDPAVVGQLFDRIRAGEQHDPRVEALSERERAVLDLIADGLTNREIGQRLFIAEKTVKNYVSAVLSKLDLQRRTQVAVFGAQLRDREARGK